ncbi:MAG: hypothetical protein HC798_01155 [Polaribacter sp.]|nr:hypothetical protein [Polaribacter sp.]
MMPIIIIGIASIFVSVLAFSNIAEAQETKIPQWIKTTTTFWSQGKISDTEYINAVEYLLKEQVMVVPSLVPKSEGQEMTKSLESLQNRVNDLEKITSGASGKVIQDIPDPKIAELNQKINELSLTILKLDEEIKKKHLQDNYLILQP